MVNESLNLSDFHDRNSQEGDVLLEEANWAEVIRLVPLLIYMLLISILGIPGNGLVCYIYRSKYDMSSSRWFIFFLASVDLLLCIVIVPSEIVTTFQQYNFTNKNWCKFSVFFNLWALLSLGFTLVIVSVDRYRKVCKPLGWQIHFNKARLLCIIAVIAAFFISLPVFSVYDIYEFELTSLKVNVSECSFRKSLGESNLAFIYVAFGMVMFTCALLTICILYCFIGGEIKQHTEKERIKRHVSLTASMARKTDHIRPITSTSIFTTKSVRFGENALKKKSVKFGEQQRIVLPKNPTQEQSQDIPTDTEEQSMTSLSEDDTRDTEILKKPMTRAQKTKSKKIRRARARKATYSMFLISLAFVLSYLPFLSLLLARSLMMDFDESMSDGWRAVCKFFLRSYLLNCAINPFIYGISDSKFRQSCKDVLYDVRERFWNCFVCCRVY
ncbi:alpha-2Da adrenergic receptor-like [Ruditapes philippinarum]|uniref:alpha-2Da adrenergic receptor-like n=1 Tax=Ruditapes philippinarum TaxID=129788 RepID=UPI00295B7224|nr:alpha-2Da adrenergic receptor-like [Ruditapes philippinarum]